MEKYIEFVCVRKQCVWHRVEPFVLFVCFGLEQSAKTKHEKVEKNSNGRKTFNDCASVFMQVVLVCV